MNENEQSSKPDAEQYARVVLWHLCTLQAEIALLQSDMIYFRGKQAGATNNEILAETSKHGKSVRNRAESLYRNALEQANIRPSKTFPHPNPE
jgi:hypothetical protein